MPVYAEAPNAPGLTKGQGQVLDFILTRQEQDGYAPTTREVQKALGLASQTSVVQFVRSLKKKGYLKVVPKRTGRPVDASPQTGENLRLDPALLDLKKTSKLFALRAWGTSMIGKGILDGDYIVLDSARPAKSGDVVAALLDGQSTLKTLVKSGRQTFLRAENPAFQDMKPQRELQVQGVMVGLFRGKKIARRIDQDL